MSVDAIGFIQQHGVILESAKGPVPNLAEAVAGERIRGSWWGHKKGRAIFRATRTARDCDQILVCRLVGGKITYVHRRLWPAIVRLTNSLDQKTISALREEHSSSGTHVIREIPFPHWVPTDVRRAGHKLPEEEARLQLGDWSGTFVQSTNALEGHNVISRERKRPPSLMDVVDEAVSVLAQQRASRRSSE